MIIQFPQRKYNTDIIPYYILPSAKPPFPVSIFFYVAAGLAQYIDDTIHCLQISPIFETPVTQSLFCNSIFTGTFTAIQASPDIIVFQVHYHKKLTQQQKTHTHTHSPLLFLLLYYFYWRLIEFILHTPYTNPFYTSKQL